MTRLPKPLKPLFKALGSGDGEDTEPAEVEQLLARVKQRPEAVVGEYLSVSRQLATAREKCAVAAGAARELEQRFEQLLQENAVYCHLDRLHEVGEEVKAVVRTGGQVRELPVHPSVDREELRDLAPWEMVRVHENIVIGVLRGDPSLLEGAQGEVAEFRGYHGADRHLARVVRRGGEEEIVRLAPSLWEHPLDSRARLVLHRAMPGFAIDLLTEEFSKSRFEVPMEQIQTRLEDLAGLDEVAAAMIDEILLRLDRTDLSATFDLEPLRGALLISYRPGMGKTALMRAIARCLHELGQERDFDVALHLIKPNETKNLYHGEDARIVREDLWGAIRARQAQPRTRPLLQLVVLDEIDSLGRRAAADHPRMSAAESDALEAFLVEMDGMSQEKGDDNAPGHVLCVGMTNRPDLLDPALKRPGRFGDLVVEMPEIDLEGALGILSIYARAASIPWYLDGRPTTGVALDQIQDRILRPALSRIFPAVVLRYSTDTQQQVDVSAGEILASVHYTSAMRVAKHKAAHRAALDRGTPAVGFIDVLEGLIDTALTQARQLEADRSMLLRELNLKVPVARVDVVRESELAEHRFVRAESA